jgi:thiamine-monophosphate kinase
VSELRLPDHRFSQSSPVAIDSVAMGQGPEFDAIRELLKAYGSQAKGIGDDAAVLRVPDAQPLVVSTDAFIENVHFRRAWISAEEAGARSTSAALSDLAAMAASPLGMLVSLAIPDDWRPHLVDLGRGIERAARAASCPIVGGNLSASTELSITTTVLGTTTRPLSRKGVKVGDLLFVTGRLGGPAAACRAWYGGQQPLSAHRTRFVSPTPRIREALWLAERGAHAGIDISDGLVGDVGHLAAASGVTITLSPTSVPLVDGVTVGEALGSGEEYEIVVAIPKEAFMNEGALLIANFEAEFGIPLTAVGYAVARESEPVTFTEPLSGQRSFDHFR